jgi:hypothetical protein
LVREKTDDVAAGWRKETQGLRLGTWQEDRRVARVTETICWTEMLRRFETLLVKTLLRGGGFSVCKRTE